MSGGGGGIIIIKAVTAALNDPLVHGSLPPDTQEDVNHITAKDLADWTDGDKDLLGDIVKWTLLNLK